MYDVSRKMISFKKILPKIIPYALHHKSLLMSIGIFLFISLSTILTLDQVQQRQINQSQAQASADIQPGGACDLSVNKGCGGPGGCRHWEKCSPAFTCIDTTNGGDRPASADACGDSAFAPVQSNPNPQPTQGNAPTPIPAQQPSVYCADMRWYCLGECAAQGVRDLFGGNDVRWRTEAAQNKHQPGACNTVLSQPAPQPATQAPTQQATAPVVHSTPVPVQYSTTSCYVGTNPYPAGYCSPTSAGSPYLYCNNTAGATPSSSTSTYIGWIQDQSSICIEGRNLCIGNGFVPSGGFSCCGGKTDESGRCSSAQSAVPAQPAATATTAPQQHSTPTITNTFIPSSTHTPPPTTTPTPNNTSTPIPTNTRVPVPTGQPTNTTVPLPTSTNTPIPPTPTNTLSPTPINTNTPTPSYTATPIPPTPTNIIVPPTNTPIPPTSIPLPPTSTPVQEPTSTPVQLATSTPASQFSTELVRNMIGFISIYNNYSGTYPQVRFVPVIYNEPYLSYFAQNYNQLKSSYPQLYTNFANRDTTDGFAIVEWMTTKGFFAMAMEDIDAAWGFCPEGVCIFIDVANISQYPALFVHEATHIDQAGVARSSLPKYMWGTGRQDTNLHRAFRSLNEGYAEYRAKTEAGHYVGSGIYVAYQGFHNQASTQGIPSFDLARKGYWSSYCEFIDSYKQTTGKSLTQLLNEVGWGKSPDLTDNYSVQDCKSI